MNKESKDHRQVLHQWETPEYLSMPHGKTWYMIAGSILGLLLIYAIAVWNLTMAIAFIALAIVFFWMEKHEPKTVNVEINSLGISYKGKFYPYHHINAFWMVYDPPYVHRIYLRIKRKRGFELLKIELNHEDPNQIRNLLIQEIPEIEGATEPMVDILARLLRL